MTSAQPQLPPEVRAERSGPPPPLSAGGLVEGGRWAAPV